MMLVSPTNEGVDTGVSALWMLANICYAGMKGDFALYRRLNGYDVYRR